MRTFSELWRKFQRAVYRKAFVRAEVKRIIPFQISAIRKARGWSQEELARRSGLTQGVISRAENPDYGNLTFNTVVKIANGLEVAFVGKFVPFSELAEWYSSMSETSAGNVPSFDTENDLVKANLDAAFKSTVQPQDLMDYWRMYKGRQQQQQQPRDLMEYWRTYKGQPQQQQEENIDKIGPLEIPINLLGGRAYGTAGRNPR